MSHLWTVNDMLVAMKGRSIGNMPDSVQNISIDSRNLGEQAAFFAIKGDRFDGHDFAASALANGASLVVVSEQKLPSLGAVKGPMIVVDDVLAALERLGRAARDRTRGQIIAVTGSVGKTTTKEMLRQTLSASGTVHASVGSYNNHWGVPLTLARMPQEIDFGVFEVGMNHRGEISTLIDMVRPNVAMITTVEAAHLGNFHHIEEIAAAKAEIMEGLVPGGTLILNRDNEQFDYLWQTAKQMALLDQLKTFGLVDGNDFQLLTVKLLSDCSCFTAKIGTDDIVVKLGAPGRHLVQNALAVLGVCAVVGADLSKASMALSKFSAEKGRGATSMRQIADGTFTLIDESYNANPASMRAAIKLLAHADIGPNGRRIAVLGDMLEMGVFAKQVHAELAEPLLDANIDIVALSGEHMHHLADHLSGNIQVYYRSDKDDIIKWLKTRLRAGDAVMVKSSLGIGFNKIVQSLHNSFPQHNQQDYQTAL